MAGEQYDTTQQSLSFMSPDGLYVSRNLLIEWRTYFQEKQKDYRDDGNQLGVKGIFPDIYRKTLKLKRSIWEDEELAGEQPREILFDLIGHCFLMVAELDKGKPDKGVLG